MLQRERKCPKAELNHRHKDFQSFALPTELSGLKRAVGIEPTARAWKAGDLPLIDARMKKSLSLVGLEPTTVSL